MFETYKSVNGEWRWRLVSKNGRIIADSSEGYVSEANVTRSVERIRRLIKGEE